MRAAFHLTRWCIGTMRFALLRTALALSLGPLLSGCPGEQPTDAFDAGPSTSASSELAVRSPSPPPVASAVPAPKREVTLLAGGDVDLSRLTGRRIIENPELDPFAQIRPLLESSDLRFANLESQLCDLGGKTVSENNFLVFAGPPGGADVVRRGKLDIVSTANNHAWDFGLRCASETIENLRRVGVQHVGTDAEGKDPMRPLEIERHGQRFAFFAITGIFNHGRLREHEARRYIADADIGALRRRIATVRDRVDRVVVSVHIGEEYQHVPIEATRSVLIATAKSGADAVLGHHTHTPQRVEFHGGVPVVMSMGNLVFHQHRDHPWTAWGYLARVTFEKDRGTRLEICPYHLFDAAPQRLTDRQEQAFLAHWDRISAGPAAARRGPRSPDGCFEMQPP